MAQRYKVLIRDNRTVELSVMAESEEDARSMVEASPDYEAEFTRKIRDAEFDVIEVKKA